MGLPFFGVSTVATGKPAVYLTDISLYVNSLALLFGLTVRVKIGFFVLGTLKHPDTYRA